MGLRGRVVGLALGGALMSACATQAIGPAAKTCATSTDCLSGVQTVEMPRGEFDLKIVGPSYFVFSSKDEPESVSDLFFKKTADLKVSRSGEVYSLADEGGAKIMVYTVQIKSDERRPRAPNPEATSGTGLEVFQPRVLWRDRPLGYPVIFGTVKLDATRNPQVDSLLFVSPNGTLMYSGARTPMYRWLNADQIEIHLYLTLCQFDRPEELEAKGGDAFGYRAGAGRIHAGVIGSRGERFQKGTSILIKGFSY